MDRVQVPKFVEYIEVGTMLARVLQHIGSYWRGRLLRLDCSKQKNQQRSRRQQRTESPLFYYPFLAMFSRSWL
jgi:hypothetical protein